MLRHQRPQVNIKRLNNSERNLCYGKISNHQNQTVNTHIMNIIINKHIKEKMTDWALMNSRAWDKIVRIETLAIHKKHYISQETPENKIKRLNFEVTIRWSNLSKALGKSVYITWTCELSLIALLNTVNLFFTIYHVWMRL